MALRTRNIIGICAGVGGLELGLQLALRYRGEQARGICYVEREAAAAASLVASMEAGWLHPAPVWSDARTFDGGRFRGHVDIVTSGDPCQGNSVAGKRRGILDDRWLLDRAIDIFDQSGAHTFFRENVPGNADGQIEVAVPALERLGCRVAVGIFSSAGTGNTMRRERLFILAERSDFRHERSGNARRRRNGPSDSGGDVAWADGGRGGNRQVQCSGKLGLLTQGDGTGGGDHRAVGRPESIGCREGWPQHAGKQGRSAAAIASSAMGRTMCDEPQGQQRGQQRGQHYPQGRQVKGGPAALSGRTTLPPAVIPGPADSRWIDVLDRFPQLQPALSEEEAESHLRRGIDAMANRTERLRATGNGVDPITAAVAFLSLSERLKECRD